jgi:hypothetical protein
MCIRPSVWFLLSLEQNLLHRLPGYCLAPAIDEVPSTSGVIYLDGFPELPRKVHDVPDRS